MLTHYIFVRRDLPLGTLAAMITHAAGESSVIFENQEGWRHDNQPAFEGATAVVLEAKSEAHLLEIAAYLTQAKIEHTLVHESNGTYAGQLMSIGVVPGSREELAPKLREFQTLKSCLTCETK